jgi:alginate O-acetyltransferase complex protein AlgI
MLFSSTIFLFAFLPIVLASYFLSRSPGWRNGVLLAASLFFYAWGETSHAFVLLVSIAANHAFAIGLDARRDLASGRRLLALAVAFNLLLLAGFKYANFFADNLDLALVALGIAPVALAPVHLPIGISFFTFQALTYVIDVHRGEAPVQRSLPRSALYIALFPQLIAGPIVRYREIAPQLGERLIDANDLAEGARRFVVGLAKKVLVANSLAVPVDAIFAVPAGELHFSIAWLGVVCFALQIYFDFSGYTDMAIGLGRCFGFRFPENFDLPYTAHSVREFWRRWHITLSTWFRDYLYIPLGGSRRGGLRTHANLLAVFFLCGLWHGASWSFVIWGLWHGSFMVIERSRLGAGIARAPALLQRSYTLAVVLLAWVFFRADDLPHALAMLSAMAVPDRAVDSAYPLALYLDGKVVFFGLLALLGSSPTPRAGLARLVAWGQGDKPRLGAGFAWLRLTATCLLLLACATSLAAGTHNPFIYFRF